MTRVLFDDFLRPKLDVPRKEGGGTYWSALLRLVDDHNSCSTLADWPSRLKFREIRSLRQLDKDEPILTFYLFTALGLATRNFQDLDRLTKLTLKAYHDRELAEQAAKHLAEARLENLWFESISTPENSVIDSVRGGIDDHPIGYVREVARLNRYVGFEGETVFDAFFGDPQALYRGKGPVGLGVEVKFTSDISHDTTYSPHRNQIVRNVEVGNAHFDHFFYLFVAPKQFWERRSRFYVYKMEDYRCDAGAEALDRDSLTRPGIHVTSMWKARIGCLAVEDIVETIYPNGHVADWHRDAGEFVEFLKVRNLWPG